ncbi:hypothetical protein BCL69_11003 [Nitrosomonas communis]|uniref:Uncharacterized protein n=1 Tax=Nitrosomonas communis TaxID=44574 RepID=A0A5D3Y797_9PROT|nr:hypothetical protein BCL69_11003 [Nitrosomonas communis]
MARKTNGIDQLVLARELLRTAKTVEEQCYTSRASKIDLS